MGVVKSQDPIVFTHFPTDAPPFRFKSIEPTVAEIYPRLFDLENVIRNFENKICQNKCFIG